MISLVIVAMSVFLTALADLIRHDPDANCRRFVSVVPFDAGLGHRFGILSIGVMLAKSNGARWLMESLYWHERSRDHELNYDWFTDVFRVDNINIPEFAHNEGLRIVHTRSRELAELKLSTSCNVIVRVDAGAWNFCAGVSCTRGWPGAYDRAYDVLKPYFVWHNISRRDVPYIAPLFDATARVFVAWHCRIGDTTYGNLTFIGNVASALSRRARVATTAVSHVVFSEGELCPTSLFCGICDAVLRHLPGGHCVTAPSASVRTALEHMALADVLVCTGSSFCELAIFAARSTQAVAFFPPPRLASTASRQLADWALDGTGYQTMKLSSAVLVDANGELVSGAEALKLHAKLATIN